jgi:hypothetical protein
MSFDPEQHGFVRLTDFKLGGTIDAFEYQDHADVDGRVDVLRLNIYMSRDGAFVNIWNGLIEPHFVEGLFTLKVKINFDSVYNETLFQGYLDRDEDAVVVLRALRIKLLAVSLPQVLRGAPNDLHCEQL